MEIKGKDEFNDVQEFLRITRNYARQLKIIKKLQLSEEHNTIVNKAINNIVLESRDYN